MIKIATYEYPVIYVYRIDDAKHKDILKVGLTSIEAESADVLEANCDDLRKKAIERINQQTGTASIDYELLYTELAFFEEDGTKYHFADYDVREVLENSGYANAKLTNNNGAIANEWVKVNDVEIVKKAIAAVKERRLSLDPNDFKKAEAATTEVIKFRDEQTKAINDTLTRFIIGDKMLWNAKMRFGKTLCALEVIKRQQYRRTLIITHRPSVRSGWFEDFNLLNFGDDYFFGHKKVAMPKPSPDDTEEQKKVNELIATKVKKFDVLEKNAAKGDIHYIFFASIQDLRGSWDKVTGQYIKNKDIFEADWDLLIVDEAHEGTKTELGKSVIAELQKHKKMRTLYLSGTPYNILDNFKPEEVYSWTYEMEQEAKQRWYEENPEKANPYEDLPRLEMRTYNIDNVFNYERDEESDFFNFAEFFRVEKEKQIDESGNELLVSTDTFVHEKEVKDFLDLMCKDSDDSNYPYSTEEYRFSLSHTLWVLPGVAEAAALSKLLKAHDILKQYYVINVAGEGDDDQDNSDSVKNVKENIASHEKTITLTCGRLTTGVSVPEWSAVFMLCGGTKISAAFYLQTIFRAQTPTKRNVFPKKKVCYAFDFAPDRSVEVVNEYVDQQRKSSRRQPPVPRQTSIETTLRFLPIIAYDGSQEKPYDTISFMKDVGKAYKEHIKRRGFRDRRLFVDLGRLTDEQYRAIGQIGLKMSQSGHTFGANDSGSGIIQLVNSGLDDDKPGKKTRSGGKKGGTKKPPKGNPTGGKKPIDKSKEAFKVLGDIYTRLPMLIFGCDLHDEDITIQRILDEVDDASWEVFMPKGVGKKEMQALMDLNILKEDRFASAASDIPADIKAADELPVTERVKVIADMIARFRFPDRETVLTPWRVVNMHLSDTIGGYDFFDENHKYEIPEPRFVQQNGISDKVFKADARILEINSKSGLYPLYMAYSLYRERIKLPQTDMLAPSVETDEGKLHVWDQVLTENLYVLCMSEMAAKITHRVLAGYRDVKTNARAYLKGADLVEDIKNKNELPNVVARIKGKNNFWGNNKSDMTFDAIVGNPPYQVLDGGAGVSATPIYNHFVNLAKKIDADHITMIMPAKWYTDGKGLGKFRAEMLSDKCIQKLVDFTDSRECFENVDIAGGVCYFHRNKAFGGDCEFVSVHKGERKTTMRDLVSDDDFIRHVDALAIIEKIKAKSRFFFDSKVSTQKPFGLRTYVVPLDEGDITLVYNKGRGPYKSELISNGRDMIEKWKIIISCLTAEHAGQTDKNGLKRIVSSLAMLHPNEICTETYMVINSFDTKEEAENCLAYVKSRFARFMVSLLASTQHLNKDKFKYVPLFDFSCNTPIDWTKSINEIDEQLFAYYGLSDSEQAFIKNTIKEMQ